MPEASPTRAPSLIGRSIASEAQPGVRYRLERLVGEGGMGSAYLALREGPHGSSSVVVKVVDPFLADGALQPELVAMKEAVALGRLNESVPPTPFVVRLVDAGRAPLFSAEISPWTAIEYVHGGVEGTTLEDRVTYSLHKTGYAFDARRAAHAIRCLAAGLTAIHAVGVIHRDLSPGNVLCCGFGETEVFKISDFGIARASGIKHTFVGFVLGTLGYSAPESSLPTASASCDVFSLAAVVYYLLTGQRYFDADNPRDAMRLFASEARPSITDHATLSPELHERPAACRAIDHALARATALQAQLRPQDAAQFLASVVPLLGDGAQAAPHSSARLLRAVVGTEDAEPPASSVPLEPGFMLKSRGRDDLVVTSVAWDTDGHALVLSQGGAHFWNGQDFVDARAFFGTWLGHATFVQRYDAGGWLVGGNSPALLVMSENGVRDRIDAAQGDVRFSLANGRLDDLLVAVGARPGEPPTLFAVSGHRWVRPLPLPQGASVTTLQRLDETRWLVAGRLRDAGAFAALYTPLEHELEVLDVPPARAIIGGAAAGDRGLALLVGSAGLTLRLDAKSRRVGRVPGEPDLSVAALDILDREWTASAGTLWTRDARSDEPWQIAWRSPGQLAPFVSLMADVGMVTAMTADGAVVEGRADVLGQSFRR